MQQIIVKKSLGLITVLFFLIGCNGKVWDLPRTTPTPYLVSDGTPDISASVTSMTNDFNNEDVIALPPISTPSAKLTSVPNAVQIALQDVELPNWPLDWQYGFSPNGEWFITKNFSMNENEPFELISTISEPLLLVIGEVNQNAGEYALIYRRGREWSPQSNAFFASVTDKPAAGCSFNQIVIYHVEADKLRSFKFSSDRSDDCLFATWSPNGEFLAITSNNPQVIYIVDKYANIQQTIGLDKTNYFIDDLYWLDSGIILNVHYIDDVPGTPRSELRLVKLNESEQQKTVFSSFEGSFEILGEDPYSSRFLVKLRSYDNPIQFKLIVYDPENETIEGQISIEADNVVRAQGASPNTAFITREGYTSYLWSYDWQTTKVTFLGEYYMVINWYAPANGFLVVMRDGENNYSLAVAQIQ